MFTAKDFSSAGSNPAMEKKQAATKKHRKDDVKMKVADNTQATEETQNVAPTPEDVPASDMKFAEDELDDKSEPLDEEVTETVPPVEPQPVEDVHEDIDDTGEISEKGNDLKRFCRLPLQSRLNRKTLCLRNRSFRRLKK